MKDAFSEILALHGNLGSARDWEALGIEGVRAIELWDHAEYDYFEMAEALAGPLSDGMERPLLLGYSLGGRLALHAMAWFPERWAGAVILSAHPGLCCVEDRLARSTSDAIWAETVRGEDWQVFLERWNRQGVFEPVSRELSERQERLEEKREAIATAFERWSLGKQEDLRRSLAAFTAPVCWVTGARDQKFTDLGQEMGSVFRDFRHVIVPDCGHRIDVEKLSPILQEWSASL